MVFDLIRYDRFDAASGVSDLMLVLDPALSILSIRCYYRLDLLLILHRKLWVIVNALCWLWTWSDLLLLWKTRSFTVIRLKALLLEFFLCHRLLSSLLQFVSMLLVNTLLSSMLSASLLLSMLRCQSIPLWSSIRQLVLMRVLASRCSSFCFYRPIHCYLFFFHQCNLPSSSSSLLLLRIRIRIALDPLAALVDIVALLALWLVAFDIQEGFSFCVACGTKRTQHLFCDHFFYPNYCFECCYSMPLLLSTRLS